MSSDDEPPPRCGRCGHTVREGETYEDRMWLSNSLGPYPGVAHTPICPVDIPRAKVPCPPCLAQRLMGIVTAPHLCHGSTWLEVHEGRLTPTATRQCPCPCRRRPKESEALRRARVEARGLSAPAHKLAEPPREE